MQPTEFFTAEDPFSFAPQISVLFRNSGLRVTGHPATGRLSAHIPMPLYMRLKNSPNQSVIVESHPLSNPEARSYEKIFDGVASSKDIPWILGPASLLPLVGTAITVAAFTIDALYRITSTTVSPSQLSVLMSTGGSFIRTVGVLQEKGVGEVLASTIYYTVKVGEEMRLFGIYSAKYGLAVD